jgi:hypothetical protein
VVHVQRRAAPRRDLDDEIVERAARVLAGDFEDEVPAGTGPQPQSVTGGYDLAPVGADIRGARFGKRGDHEILPVVTECVAKSPSEQ